MAQDDLPTAKQLAFATALATRLGEEPSARTYQSRKRLAAWIANMRHAEKAIVPPNASMPQCDEQSRRKIALESAVKALLDCDPNDREELMIAGLQRGWGDGPVESFLEEELQRDADWWALAASPLVLAVYLKAIRDALGEASVGKTTRKILRGLDI